MKIEPRSAAERAWTAGRSAADPIIAALSRSAAGLLTLGLLAGVGCDGPDGGEPGVPGAPSRDPAADADRPSVEEPIVQDPAASALFDAVLSAESELTYQGWRSIVGGAREDSRDTRMFVARYPSGQHLVQFEARGDDSPPRRWSFRSRFAWVGHPELLAASYRLRIDAPGAPEPGPIAFRNVVRLCAEPVQTSDGRPRLELLVDRETKLVLAETYRDSTGAEIRSHRFESIEYGPPAEPMPAEIAEPIPCADPTAEGCDPPPSARLVPARLPSGFRRVSAERSPCGAWVEGFSDGVASIAIQQTTLEPDSEPRTSSGATPSPGTSYAELREIRRSRWPGGWTLAADVAGKRVAVSGTLADTALADVLRGLRPAADRR